MLADHWWFDFSDTDKGLTVPSHDFLQTQYKLFNHKLKILQYKPNWYHM